MATAKKTNEKAETPTTEEAVPSALTEEMERLPESEDELLSIVLRKAAEELVKYDEQEKIRLANSLSEDAIKNAAETHENEELVKLRDEKANTDAEIERLEAELEKQKGVLEAQEQRLYDKAETILESTVDKDLLKSAVIEKDNCKNRINAHIKYIKDMVPDWNTRLDFQQWIRSTNGRINNNATTATNGGRTSANRDRAERIRKWAREKGMAVSDRGRIPQHVIIAYEAVFPNDAE